MTNIDNNVQLSFLDDSRTVNDNQNKYQTCAKKNTKRLNFPLQYANEILANLTSLGCNNQSEAESRGLGEIDQSEAKSRGLGEIDQSEGDLRIPL